MANLNAKELLDLSDEELRQQLVDRSASLRNLRFQMVTGAVENVRALRNTRRDIARIKTILRMREVAAEKEAKTT